MLPPKVPNYIARRISGQFQRALQGNVSLNASGVGVGKIIDRITSDGGGDILVFPLNSESGGPLFVLGFHGLGGDGELG